MCNSNNLSGILVFWGSGNVRLVTPGNSGLIAPGNSGLVTPGNSSPITPVKLGAVVNGLSGIPDGWGTPGNVWFEIPGNLGT